MLTALRTWIHRHTIKPLTPPAELPETATETAELLATDWPATASIPYLEARGVGLTVLPYRSKTHALAVAGFTY